MHKKAVQNLSLPKATVGNQSLEFFQSRILLSPAEAGAACGWAKQTVYNKLNQGDFPIPLVNVDGRKMVRTLDLVEFVAKLHAPAANEYCKSCKVGRPTKSESTLRKAAKLGGSK